MPSLASDDYALLRQLEESLWKSETRFDPAYMETVLDPEFFEFGRSGKAYRREDTLGVPAGPIRATLPLADFRVDEVGDGVALVTYVSEVAYDEIQFGNRSSLWIKHDGRWRLRFHQGTPTRKRASQDA